MSFKIEAVKGSPKSILGEGPHWDSQKGELLYVDIIGKSAIRYDPKTAKFHEVVLDTGDEKKNVSLVIPVEGQQGKYLVTAGNEVKVMEWDGFSATPTSFKPLYTVDAHAPTNALNDGKCDAKGRLWAGTYGHNALEFTKAGALYSFNLKGEVKKHCDQIGIANGLVWSADNTLFYYIDSLTNRVDVFDFDVEEGTISNPRTAFEFAKPDTPGFSGPDGMTIDTDGNLWIAYFGASKVFHVDPKKSKLISEITFPAKNVTSVNFGGPNLDILYVTTANFMLSEEDSKAQPLAGSLFAVTNLGVKGLSGGINYKGPI